ncbi:hypothetical protein R1flu_013366 [Riccia fluitans]|uniref:Uncharacterized protein n=1 Tax=Riccia fluitans TaxID=41844 RepID=A0ABD1YDE1_9MARC
MNLVAADDVERRGQARSRRTNEGSVGPGPLSGQLRIRTTTGKYRRTMGIQGQINGIEQKRSVRIADVAGVLKPRTSSNVRHEVRNTWRTERSRVGKASKSVRRRTNKEALYATKVAGVTWRQSNQRKDRREDGTPRR